MKVDAVGIRMPIQSFGPKAGTHPIVVFAEQGLTGAPKGKLSGLFKGLISSNQLDDVYLLIDRSSSMKHGIRHSYSPSKLAHVSELTQSLTEGHFPKGTRASLIAFDHVAELIYQTEKTKRYRQIPERVKELEPRGSTSFENAFELVRTLIGRRNLELGRVSRNVIIFPTDGNDKGDRERSSMLARQLRDLNAGTFLVGVGVNYTQGNMFKLAGDFGYSGWGHTPMERGPHIFGGLIPEFMKQASTSEHYLRINIEGSVDGAYGVAPAMREVNDGLFFIGYQQQGIGVCFERHDDVKLTLQLLNHASDRDFTTQNIPIVDYEDAGTYFEQKKIADIAVGPLLMLLCQLKGDTNALIELRQQYPELTNVIGRLQGLSQADPSDPETQQNLRAAVSDLSGTISNTLLNKDDETHQKSRYDLTFSGVPESSSSRELPPLHSGGLGRLSQSMHGDLPSNPDFDAEAYRAVVPKGGPCLHLGIPSLGERSQPYDLSSLTTDSFVRIGRNPKSDIIVEASGVSRSHCEIHRHDDGFYIVDRNSRNGTFVNGVKIDPMTPTPLNDGDKLLVGIAVITFSLGTQK